MSHRRAQTGPSISLFPFLAVLLCTMGSLLVLLVLFSRSAQEADSAAEQEAARLRQDELALARDELAWRLDQLQGVRERTAEDLARARLQLAGIEDAARALIDEFHELERTAAALAEDRADEPDDEDEPVESLEQRLAEARRELEEAREEAAERPPAYAVVPYSGDKGTHRRPLYIECCIDGVFLQPEGIRLGPADFEGPPGPGNPLASGLRAAREYLAVRPGQTGEPAAQPYPLLLVRPSGVMAYYAARESLQSWGSDFGYQFIDEDWELTFPPADPALAEAETRAIEDARRRLTWLAEMGRTQRSRPKVQYRAATTRGGVVSTSGPSVLGDQSRFDWTEEQASAAAAGRGFRGGDAGDGAGDAVLGGGGGSDSRWARGQAAGNPATGQGTAAGGGTTGDRYLGPSKFYGGSGGGRGGSGEGGAGDAVAAGTAADEPWGAGAAAGPEGFPAGLAAGDGAAGQPGGAAGPGGEAGPGGGGTGDAAAGSDATASGTGSGAGAAGSPGSTAGGGGDFGPAMPGLTAGGGAAAGGTAGADCPEGGCSLAGSRGSDWASLATAGRSIPLTRPIRLECAADEFRVLGSGGRVAARIPIRGATAGAVDPLVREVHATVTRWGIAGDRMYWKPELVLSATADGDGRRADLEQLLADSGLDTRRAEETDTVRRLPPVRRTGGLFRSR